MSKLLPKDWKEFALKDSALKSDRYSFTGGPFGSNLKAEDYTESGVRIIQLQNIGDGQFLNKYKIYTSEQKADELSSCNIFPGDIILSKMGDPVARATIIPNFYPRYLMASDGIRLAVDKERFDTKFVHDSINANPFRNQAETISTGTTRKRIGLTDLRELTFLAPPLPEQQKIASILTAVDEVIASTQAQINKLKDLKTGMMQELLTKGIGHTEFKDSPVGRIPKAWDIHTVGDLVDVVDPQPDHRTPAEVLVGIPYIGLGDINKDGLINFAGARQVSKEVFEKQMNSFPIHKDAFIFGKIGTIGNPCILPTNRFYCLSANVILLTSSDSLLVRYLFQVFTSGIVDKQILLQTSTTSQPALGIKKVRDFVVPIPGNRQEIEKLVNLLASLDSRSSQIKNKLTHMVSLKKSLMQDLLTGAVRVKM